jgi:DNA-binding IclR family transcriptional regulator
MTSRNLFERTSPSNRSVERALSILRAFRPGLASLGNAELAERTGLARSTVSRLTQTLVENGFLRYDFVSGTYRLGPPLLSLAHALRLDSEVLNVALPLMRDVAEGQRINVGLAVADLEEMVYLESVRRNRSGLFRHVTAGSRVPVELTSLGRAYLATLSEENRKPLVAQLLVRQGKHAREVAAAIDAAVGEVRRRGYCRATWQVGIVSIAAPLNVETQPPYVFNISFAVQEFDDRRIRDSIAPLLLTLVEQVRQAIAVPP